MNEIKGTNILILGFSREGQSTYRWLKKHNPEVAITIADQNATVAIPDPSIKQILGESYLSRLSDFDTVIRSPGVSPYLPELTAFLQGGGYVTSATNIFLSMHRERIVGVTGTKGKSTTASLTTHLLASKFSDVRLVGNIGKPALDYLDGVNDDTWFVAELSSHQLADARYSPHIAVLLGIVPEHLDYYPDFASYVEAKSHITQVQTETDVVVYNPDSPQVKSVVSKSQAKHLTFSGQGVVSVKDGNIVINNAAIVMSVAEVPLLGNTENIMAAVAVAFELGLSPEEIKKAIVPFRPLPHRLEKVAEYKGITFINDSLATIPEAAIHALTALGDRVGTLIAGGYDRHIDFSALGEYLSRHPVRNLILFPDTGIRIWDSIAQKDGINKFDVSSMEEAVRLAYEHTSNGTICLLSPASASYNMFRDYADRGEQFREWVKKLAQ